MGDLRKRREFEKIARDIKDVKIQGARNIALAALKAYSLFPNKASKNKLISLRPTEPMLRKVLDLAETQEKEKILLHFSQAQEKINPLVSKLIKNGDIVFTHCHSTNVSAALIHSKKHGKQFQVFNTETRPLYQGRRTAKELKSAGIKVTMFVDSAFATVFEKENKKDKIFVNEIFIGADALLKKGIINKVGSRTIAELAKIHGIPLYIVADSWKFTSHNVPIEQRGLQEIWAQAPRNIKIQNPAFEFVPKKYIRGIISELGFQTYDQFLRKVN